MKEIQLSQGKVALVDDADYERLSHFKWYALASGYAVGWIGGKLIRLHRLIMKAPPGVQVDHINCDPLDCRRSNLRLATGSQNLRNQRKRSGKSSQYKGVSWVNRDKRWVGCITVDRKSIHLGNFRNEIDAALAYDRAAAKYFGEFARPNFHGNEP